MQLNRAAHGWDSFQSLASHKHQGFHILPHRWLLTNDHLIYLQRKNPPNWNCRWFQTTGPQVALPCLRLFTSFMLLLSLQPGLRALLKAYLRVYIYFENRWRCGEPECDMSTLLGDCLADAADSRQGHGEVSHAVVKGDLSCYCILKGNFRILQPRLYLPIFPCQSDEWRQHFLKLVQYSGLNGATGLHQCTSIKSHF